jgi:hypothetical protein
MRLLVLVFSQVFLIGLARADDLPIERAKILFVEGLKLRDAGDAQGSLQKLQEAHAAYPTPVTALEVGRALGLSGKLMQALATFESVAAMPTRATEGARSHEARQEATHLATELRSRVPMMRVDIVQVGCARPCVAASLQVWLDGEPSEPLAKGLGTYVDPGRHVVTVQLDGTKQEQAQIVEEGQSKTLSFQFSTRAQAKPSDVHADKGGGVHPLTYIGFGLAGASLLAGSVTGAMVLGRSSDLKDTCTPQGICPPSLNVEATQSLGTFSTVAFVATGVFAGLGLFGVFLRSSRGTHAAAPFGLRGTF